MTVLVSTIGLSPMIIPELIDELGKRGVRLNEVILLPTKEALASYHALKLAVKHGKYKESIKIAKIDLPFSDIKEPRDCHTFRNRVSRAIRTAIKVAGGEGDVYVSIAGGRKTMPIDALLVAMAWGIENIYHIIAEEVPGIAQEFVNFTRQHGKELEEYAEKDIRPPEEFLNQVFHFCYPSEELTIHLVKVPVPKLTQEAMKDFRSKVLG